MKRTIFTALVLLVGMAWLSCSDSGDNGENPQVLGTVRTTLSDPPTCKGSGGVGDLTFNHVWVTVTQVRAHVSGDAEDGDGGWVTLADLREQPKQIDLLSGDDTQCVLTVLGSATGLPAGDYQQIRLHLLSNKAAPAEVTPEANACESADEGGFNCAETTSGELKTLRLSSQDQTGIKIPPGRIVGGPIHIDPSVSTDINIEFNACRSIVAQGNGKLRLKPTLSAGEVSLADSSSISGKVVVNVTFDALPAPATIVVFAEQPVEDGPDRVVLEKFAGPADGSFVFCPLPTGLYDVVVAAVDGNGVAYNATVTFDVPTGTNMGNIPLEPESGADTSLATIVGQVTSQGEAGPVQTDLALSALQSADLSLVTIPLFGASTGNLTTQEGPACPADAACADYILEVPPSNPLVGTFTEEGTTYAGPAEGSVLYTVDARAFNGSESNCNPSSLQTAEAEGVVPLEVSAGGSVTAKTLSFVECSEIVPE
jgi:hypothetical protein